MRNKFYSSLKCIFIFIILSSDTLFAQDYYEIIYEYTDSNFVKLQSVLLVKGELSLFKILDDRSSGVNYTEDGTYSHYVLNDELSTFVYSDAQNVYKRIPYPKSRKGTVYTHQNEQINWQMRGETKVIEGYTCQKANALVRGRNYEVWFTEDILITDGPLSLHGLPGLIIEVKEKFNFCSLKVLEIRKHSKADILNQAKQFFVDNKVLGYKEYEEFMKRFVVELKISKANKIAELVSKNSVTDFELEIPNGEYNWVSYIIDIPIGTIEELEKIQLY